MCGIGVSSKGDYIANGFSARTNPGTSRFNGCRMGRVGNIYKKFDTNDNEEKDEQAADIADIIHACGIRLYTLAPHRLSLEQIFFQTIDALSTNNEGGRSI